MRRTSSLVPLTRLPARLVHIVACVYIQERRKFRVNRPNPIRTYEDGTQAVRQGGGRRKSRRTLESPYDRIALVHGADRIEEIEFRHGSIVVPETLQEEPVQRGSEEGSVARGDENASAAGHSEALSETLDGPETGPLVRDDDGVREYGPNSRFRLRGRNGHDGLVHQVVERFRDSHDQRATLKLLQGFRSSEAARLASGEDECGVHAVLMRSLHVKERRL